MKERCPHLFADRDRIRRSITMRKKKDITSCSETCDVSGDHWCCLQCGHIGCGRSSNGHAKLHFLDTRHQVAMEVLSGTCFCYECDMFISREDFLAKVSSVFTYIQKAMGVENIQHFSPKKKRINSDPVLSRKKRRMMMESMNNNGGEGQEGERKAGLVNMSNTCFMNAVIQSLLFTPIFSHHFLSRKSLVSTGAGGSPGSGGVSRVSGPTTRSSSSRFEKNSNFGANQEIVNPINVELAQLFSTLRSGTVSLVEPESLYNSICKSLPAFYGFQQHDAQEFLRYFLDEIHKELEDNSNSILPPPLLPSDEKKEESKEESKTDSLGKTPEDLEVVEASSSPISPHRTPSPTLTTTTVATIPPPATKTKSVVAETFQGSLLSEIKCPLCGKVSRKFDPFMDLSIHIPHKFVPKSRSQTLQCTLHELLDAFVGPETLCSKDYSCLSCASSEPPMKQFTIHSSPNVLCLHIKRFQWPNRSKITTVVEFPETLDLREFMKVSEPSPYYLFSVICHTGYGTWAGHYTSYCLSKEGEWYLYDDDVVSPASWEEVKETEAYVLFYAKGEFRGKNE